MDPASLSDSDFEVIADYSNQPITKLIQKVNLEPDFKKEFLRQPIIKTFNPNRFVNLILTNFRLRKQIIWYLKTAPKRYDIKIIKPKKNSNQTPKIQISLKAEDKVIIPHLYDLQKSQIWPVNLYLILIYFKIKNL
ncbi:Hypothetical_protein [Hexamita inflata]|uniref:Hypothetical_protein n=1 Tax=Hexamita inflata TaxID=28002 RepID=A0AA86QY84_9EUKA|nr:Hypothetical protein HINF_LOCUS53097 [Hexamita inflata]